MLDSKLGFLYQGGMNRLSAFCRTSLVVIVVNSTLLSLRVEAGTLVVTALASSGSGSLRAAIAAANPGDSITFAVSGTITNLTGELVVDKDLTIAGPGPSQLAVSGNNARRGFNIAWGVTVTISGLTITNGHAADGAAGTNYANPGGPGADGGGIYSSGNLTLSNCVVTQCRSGQGGDGYTDTPPYPQVGNGPSYGGNGGNGGGICNAGTLTLTACTLSCNTSGTGGVGGGETGASYGGTAGGNGGNGGGLYDAGTAAILACTFITNTAGAGGNGGLGGGGATSQPGASGGRGGDGGSGGAIFSQGSPVLSSCTLAGNNAGHGGFGGMGGIGYSAPLSGPTGNGGTGGDGGTGGSGGGLFTWGAFQWVACTVTGNSASYGGMGGTGGRGGHTFTAFGDGGNGGNGGAGGNGGGAGAWSSSMLQNVAVAQNAKGSGGAGGLPGASGGIGVPGLRGYSGSNGSGADLSGTFVSNGYNLIGLDEGNSGFTDGTNGDRVGSGTALQALLGASADHGGPTFTCLPLAGSPAVDSGDDSLLGSPLSLATDQRGQPRLSGAHVDIGAFELQPAALPLRLATCSRTTNRVTQMTLTNLPGTSLTMLCATNPALALSNWTVLGWVPETAAGRYQFVDSAATNLVKRFYRLRSP
jgi:hypothetical protein